MTHLSSRNRQGSIHGETFWSKTDLKNKHGKESTGFFWMVSHGLSTSMSELLKDYSLQPIQLQIPCAFASLHLERRRHITKIDKPVQIGSLATKFISYHTQALYTENFWLQFLCQKKCCFFQKKCGALSNIRFPGSYFFVGPGGTGQ